MNALTPLYHEALDDWGLCAGTRIWDASGNFVAVEDIKPGDLVFGITYRLEKEYVPRSRKASQRAEDIVDVWRPVLCARRVRSVKTVTARAWQLTFGDANKLFEHRRLVAGGATQVHIFPLSRIRDHSKRLVDCLTALDNPRKGSGLRQAMVIDEEASEARGEIVMKPTEQTGTAKGDLSVIIPYEHYAGQTGMIDTQIRPYARYVFTQIREVSPLLTNTTLYQLDLASDDAGGARRRCNVIAQTPFAPESERKTIVSDLLAEEVAQTINTQEFAQKWDDWAHNHKITDGPKTEIETTKQGMFYETQPGSKTSKDLEQKFGITGGWLNGGILIELPVTDEKETTRI